MARRCELQGTEHQQAKGRTGQQRDKQPLPPEPAELGAILHVYRIIEGDILAGKKIGVVSDSEYAIRCVTSYGKRCEIEGWKKDMPNKELVKKVYELYRDKPNVRFTHVMAHTGFTDAHSIGNDGADRLANAAVGFLG